MERTTRKIRRHGNPNGDRRTDLLCHRGAGEGDPTLEDWKDYERYLDRRSLRTDTQIIIGLFVGMLIVNLIMGVALAWSK